MYTTKLHLSKHHGTGTEREIDQWNRTDSLEKKPSYAQLTYDKLSSVTQMWPTLCDSMDCNTPGFLFITNSWSLLTHVHQVADAVQSSYPLSSPSPPAFNLSQHQGLSLMSQLFASGSSSIRASASASVLPMNIQD